MLLPLDEVPVHVHRFAARAPCDSQGSECQCGIHTAEAASALPSRKTERAAKEKPTPISHIFFSTCCAYGTPTRRHALGRLPTPPPLPEHLLLRLHRKLPSAPPASTQEVSESENQPATRGTAHSEVQGDDRGIDRGIDRPIARPSLFAAHRRSSIRTQEFRFQTSPFSRSTRLPFTHRFAARVPLRFERLRVPVWNPYSRGRLSPAKSEDRKGGEGKTDANLTHFF